MTDVDDSITTIVSTLVAIAAALGGLRGYDVWMGKRRRDAEHERTDSPTDRHRSLMMAIGREQEQSAEVTDLLRRIHQEIEATNQELQSIERQFEMARERLRAVEEGVAVLRDRRNRN